MGILILLATILLIVWAIAFIGFAIGGLIHVLLAVAVIAILVRIIRGK